MNTPKQNFGFTFAVEETEAGNIRSVRVIDRWSMTAEPNAPYKTVQTLTLQLQPFATYTEAHEIATYLNNKLHYAFTPVINVKGA